MSKRTQDPKVTEISERDLRRLQRNFPLSRDIRINDHGHISVDTPVGRFCVNLATMGTQHTEISCYRGKNENRVQ